MKYKNKIEKLENKLGNHEIKTAYTKKFSLCL